MRLWALILVPLAAAAAPALDVHVEQSAAHGTVVDPLSVNLTVSLTDRSTGQPPASEYDVFAFATAAAEKSITYPCGLDRANDPAAPLGRYSCTVIVDHGGPWDFHAAVNKRRLGSKDPVVPLAQGKTTIEVSGSAVPVSRPNAGRGIKGRVWEVLVLWGHSAAAAAWLAFIALFAALALPAARRRISEVGLYHLEERFDLLLKGTWTAAGLTVASGTYLLLKQTAYKTPFSPSAVHGVFALPYARPYFLALGTKLALYTLMIGASLPLIREARRQLCTGASTVTKSPSAPDPWAATPQAPATGRTLVAAAPPVVAAPARPASGRGPGRMGARLGALVVAGGGVGLWICVTLLKYFHELVEASRLR